MAEKTGIQKLNAAIKEMKKKFGEGVTVDTLGYLVDDFKDAANTLKEESEESEVPEVPELPEVPDVPEGPGLAEGPEVPAVSEDVPDDGVAEPDPEGVAATGGAVSWDEVCAASCCFPQAARVSNITNGIKRFMISILFPVE